MRALVKFAPGPGNVAVQEVPPPQLTPGKVLIDVHAVAICGTDRSAIAALSGQELVPVAEIEGEVVADSMRIVERLERLTPEPALYPDHPASRAMAGRSMASIAP